MIATVSRLTKGHSSYYGGGSNVLVEPDHEQVRPMARFEGDAARKLGVEGERIQEKDPRLNNLFEGRSPDGSVQLRRLYDRQRKDHIDGKVKTLHARPFFDVTVNAPKDISILYATGSEKDRAQILACHQRATDSVRGYLSERSRTRIDSAGKKTEPVKPVFAVVDHDTNRSNEPHLHSHILMFNGGERKDGKWTALDAQSLFYEHHKIGSIYNQKLEHEFGQVYENKTERVALKKGYSFKVEGVSEKARRGFSQRSADIKDAREKLEAKGIKPNPKVVQLAVLDTRELKDAERDKASTKAEWKERAKKLQIDAKKILKAKNQKIMQQQQKQEKLQEAEQKKQERSARTSTTRAQLPDKAVRKALPGTYQQRQQKRQLESTNVGLSEVKASATPKREKSAVAAAVADKTKTIKAQKQPVEQHLGKNGSGKTLKRQPKRETAQEIPFAEKSQQVRHAEVRAVLLGRGVARTGQNIEIGKEIQTVKEERQLIEDVIAQERKSAKFKLEKASFEQGVKSQQFPLPQPQPKQVKSEDKKLPDNTRRLERQIRAGSQRRAAAKATKAMNSVSARLDRIAARGGRGVASSPAAISGSRSLRSPKQRNTKERVVDSLDEARSGAKALVQLSTRGFVKQSQPVVKQVVHRVRNTSHTIKGANRMAFTPDTYKAVDVKHPSGGPAKFTPDFGKHRGNVVAEKAHQDFIRGKKPVTAPGAPTIGEKVVRKAPGGDKVADVVLKAKYGKQQVRYKPVSQSTVPENKVPKQIKLANSTVTREMTTSQIKRHDVVRSR